MRLFILFAGTLLACEMAWSAHTKITTYVPMSDGIQLRTDVYTPTTGGPSFAVILERTPYDPASAGATTWTDQGYIYICQTVRGRYGSTGTFRPFADDGWGDHKDGAETVDWILGQPWCNGKVATYGGSANAITSVRLGAASQKLVCQIFQEGGTNFTDHLTYQGGVYRQGLCDGWLTYGVGTPSYNEWRQHLPSDTAFWSFYNAEARAPLVTAPGMHVGGWWDIFARGTISNFVQRQYLGGPGAKGNQKLSMRPTTHGGWGPAGEFVRAPNFEDFRVTPRRRDFARYWLLGTPSAYMSEPPVSYYIVGPDTDYTVGWQYRTADKWPPFPPNETPHYLTHAGALETSVPASGSRTYSFNPYNPAPSLGGQELTLPSGPFDQRPVSNRSDILKFESAAMTAPLEVTGHFKVRLFVSSDAPDTDFTAKLVDVYPAPDGREILMLDSIQRVKYRLGNDQPQPALQPGQVVEITIDLGDISWMFATGHKIGLHISSSNSTRFQVNPNTGEDFQTGSMRVAQNTVHMGGVYASALLLPQRTPSVDTDNDGFTDEQEWNTPNGDMDNDGITDAEEYFVLGSNPRVAGIVLATMTLIHAVDGSNVDVTFSRPVGPSALAPANYRLSGSGKGTMADHPHTVTRQQNSNVYRLTWNAGEMRTGGDITITISNILDESGRGLLAPYSRTEVGNAMGVAPTILLKPTVPKITSLWPIQVAAVLSEPFADMGPHCLMLTNATVSDFVVNGLDVNFSLWPKANGTVTAVVPANIAHDLAGNANTISNTLVHEFLKVGGDLDGNGEADAVDVQLAINSALRLPANVDADVNCDKVVDIVDVQLIINAALRYNVQLCK